MPAFVDLTGETFGRLTVVGRVAMKQFCQGSRIQRKKVKGVKSLAHAQMRSLFGGSED